VTGADSTLFAEKTFAYAPEPAMPLSLKTSSPESDGKKNNF
jgi:hypothetical protein